MNGFDLLNLLGALALFLYGMKVMSDALMQLAGNRLREIMIKLTSNRFKGVLTGLGITTLIQSSSASTLMIVSFVSAGLLSLAEAISLIMGANIGTTFTAWLIAIVGFKVKLTSVALPLTMVGFVLSTRKEEKTKNIGLFLIGFCLLFIGLEMMKSTVPDLRQDPTLMHFMSAASNLGHLQIFGFIAIGTLLTIVLQSSSATMAITLVAAAQGIVGYEAAAAIVLGENIGTTITANMAAFVSGIHARRAALAHLFFNLVGVTWVVLLFDQFTHLVTYISTHYFDANPLQDHQDIPIALSIFHSLFNVINTLLLIGFIKQIANLVTLALPAKEITAKNEAEPLFLNEQFLQYPETAMQVMLQETLHIYRTQIPAAIGYAIDVKPDWQASKHPLSKVIEDSGIPLNKSVEAYKKTYVKPVYIAVLDFGARLQAQRLDRDQVTAISELKQLNRNVQQILRAAIVFQTEYKSYKDTQKPKLIAERNALRYRLLELISLYVEGLEEDDHPKFDLEIRAMREQLREEDVELIARVEQHINDQILTAQEGASLMACNMAIITLNQHLSKSVRRLVKLTDMFDKTLYEPDRI